MTVKGIIFDLDGTLIDSMGIWSKIDREFLIENGVDDPPSDISEQVKKMTIDRSAQHFIDRFGLSCTKEYVIKRIEELVRQEYEENIQLKPHAAELLGLLDDMKLPYGIATATYRRLAEAVLKRCRIYDRFSFILSDSDYPMGKNFPDIFYGAAEKLGHAPSEILVIEDSLHCIETAKNAGFITAAVYDKLSEADSERIAAVSDIYAGGLDEIGDILQKMRF